MKLSVLILVLFSVVAETADAQFNPRSADQYLVPIGTKLTFHTVFMWPGVARNDSNAASFFLDTTQPNGYSRVHVTVYPSEFFCGYDNQTDITVTVESDSQFCWDGPFGVGAHKDSIGGEWIDAFFIGEGAWYDSHFIGSPTVTPDTLNFGGVPIGSDDSLGFGISVGGKNLGVPVDSVPAYRSFIPMGFQQPFAIVDSVGLQYCFNMFSGPEVHFRPTHVGLYRATVYLLDPLTNDSIPLILIGEGVAASVGNSAEETSRIAISPNPCDKHCTLSMSDGQIEHVTVRNLLGESVLDIPSLHNDEFSINTASLPDGIYFIEARSNENVYRERVIVAH